MVIHSSARATSASPRTTSLSPARTCRRSARARQRRGLAVSELAICLPMLVLIVFGSLQMCNVIYLKHAMVTAAYEGSLEMAKSTTNNANVESRIQQVLDARRINNATIEILPVGTDIAATPHDTTLTIRITASTASNLSVTGFVTFPVTMEHSLVCSR